MEVGLHLRELARRLDLSPAYLSKIERGQFNPPSEKNIVKIAEIIGLNRDELLWLAGKMASDVKQVIQDNPGPMTHVVRSVALRQGSEPDEWPKEMEHDAELREAIQAVENSPKLTKAKKEQFVLGMKLSWVLANQPPPKRSAE